LPEIVIRPDDPPSAAPLFTTGTGTEFTGPWNQRTIWGSASQQYFSTLDAIWNGASQSFEPARLAFEKVV
jgi:hypothetical protein